MQVCTLALHLVFTYFRGEGKLNTLYGQTSKRCSASVIQRELIPYGIVRLNTCRLTKGSYCEIRVACDGSMQQRTAAIPK